jgi:hypothetical protein
MTVLRSRLWNVLVAGSLLIPAACAAGSGNATVFTVVTIACALGMVRAFNLGVVAGRDGLVVREPFYTKRLGWSDLIGATVMKFTGYRLDFITYVPVLHLRGEQTMRLHSLGGYHAETVRRRVETLNELISGRRRYPA